MMKLERKIILSIETAVEGSISIREGEDEIDFWSSDKEKLNAEDFLAEIAKILDKNKIAREDIKLIAVADGLGSATGMKIGLATARGLATALNCKVIEASFLNAILKFAVTGGDGQVVIIIPSGKNHFLLEKVEIVNQRLLKNSGKANIFSNEKLVEEIKFVSEIPIVIHRNIFEIYNSKTSVYYNKSRRFIVIEKNMATVIGNYVGARQAYSNASDNI